MRLSGERALPRLGTPLLLPSPLPAVAQVLGRPRVCQGPARVARRCRSHCDAHHPARRQRRRRAHHRPGALEDGGEDDNVDVAPIIAQARWRMGGKMRAAVVVSLQGCPQPGTNCHWSSPLLLPSPSPQLATGRRWRTRPSMRPSLALACTTSTTSRTPRCRPRARPSEEGGDKTMGGERGPLLFFPTPSPPSPAGTLRTTRRTASPGVARRRGPMTSSATVRSEGGVSEEGGGGSHSLFPPQT